MRFKSLESLRGLAATIVVIHHHLLVFPALFPYQPYTTGWAHWLTFSPLHLLWAGSEAVLFFFLLSGFVLSLPYWRGEGLDMIRFVARRWWRIWVPLMVAVTASFALYALIGYAPVAGTSWWFGNIWKEAGWPAFAHHALMLGRMDDGLIQWAFLPVVWSLKWEMWLSLLLPVVLLVAGWRSSVVLILVPVMLAAYHASGGGDIASALLRYTAMFVLGAWLARKRERVSRMVAGLSPSVRVGVLILTLLLIPVHWYTYTLTGAWQAPVNDLVALFGSAALVALALGWEGFRRWLERPALTWLGRVSFSLYLYHTLVLTLVVRLGAGRLPLHWLVLLSFVVTFPVSHLMYLCVERPAISMSRRIKAATLATTTLTEGQG